MVVKFERSVLWQRLRRRTNNPYVFLLTSVLLCSLVLHVLVLDIDDTSHSSSSDESLFTHRTLLAEDSSKKGEYPNNHFTLKQMRQGAVILFIIGMCYMFLALSIACDEFFIPALVIITEKLNISEDVAGATFMAAGGSMPELCTSFIGVFAAPDSNVGFGTIVGSAVFNVLFVIGMCAVFSKEVLHLTWWPLFRDCMFYSAALIILIGFFEDSAIEWWESLVLILTYIIYVTFMKYNHNVERWVKRMLKSNKVSAIHSKGRHKGSEDAHLEKAVESLCTSSKANNGLPCFRHGVLQLVIHSMDPLGEASIAVKVNRLKRLKCLNVKVGMETDSAAGSQSVVNNGANDEHHQQFHLSVINNSGNDASISSIQKNNKSNTDNETSKTDLYTQEGDNTSRKSSVVNGELPHVHIFPSENTVNRPSQSPVPGMVEQSNNGYSTSAESRDSQSTVLQHSSNHQLVEIEDAREACVDDDSEPIDLSWPSGWKDRLAYLIRAPIMFCMYYTAQDIKRPEKRPWYPWTFICSMLWIVGFSYLMVWFATEVGYTLGISTEVMGLTFLAAGTSIPDLITSVLVARKGFGDMAVSSSIGSNMFDVTIGLPLPWLIRSAIDLGAAVTVSSSGLFCSVFLLFIMLIAVVVTIAVNKWKMSRLLGGIMFLFYVIFLVISLLLQEDIIKCPEL